MTRASALRELLASGKSNAFNLGLIAGAAFVFWATWSQVAFGYLGGIVTVVVLKAGQALIAQDGE